MKRSTDVPKAVKRKTSKQVVAREAPSGRFVGQLERDSPPRHAVYQQGSRLNVVGVPTLFYGGGSEVIASMRAGAPAEYVLIVADSLGITQEKLFECLRLPKSTLKKRISANQPLAAVEQDRIYRANRILARAAEVLEDNEAAKAGINSEDRSLGGDSPLALLDTEAGYELVLDTLGRIEYGVIS